MLPLLTKTDCSRFSLPTYLPCLPKSMPLQVMGLGIPPMHLLVVVSQWHDALVVRCYDFIGGEIRQAESRSRDSALISEFKVCISLRFLDHASCRVLSCDGR